jgi:hypothetical protein
MVVLGPFDWAGERQGFIRDDRDNAVCRIYRESRR